MTRPSRTVLAQRAQELRAAGLLQREIAVRLGVSRSYVAALYNDPDGAKARARKDSYRGTCESCGAPTDGSNGRGAAPTRCDPCYRIAVAAQHGTRSKYNLGCRCAACTAVATVAHREYMARRKQVA